MYCVLLFYIGVSMKTLGLTIEARTLLWLDDDNEEFNGRIVRILLSIFTVQSDTSLHSAHALNDIYKEIGT